MIPVQWDHAKITDMIKFSTSDNAFRVLWLVLSILVISSSTLIWPCMVNDCAKLKMFSLRSEIFLWIKPKKKKKNFLVESLDRYRSTRKGKKSFLWWSFFRFRSDFLAFFACISYFKYLEFKEFTKTVIPFALVGYKAGYSQLGATCLVGYLPSPIQDALME